MNKCNICDEEFDNKISLNNHLRFHKKYDAIKDDIIDDYVNNNFTYRELIDKYNSSNVALIKILKDVDTDPVKKKRNRNTLSHKHSNETKKRMSIIRKNWLKENPEKHVWKYRDKFISKPCEFLKSKLLMNNVSFVPEYTPNIENNFRNYSIDISFPDKKIGIEVNGNQHYNDDGTLKDYYKERNKYFIDNGWKIYQIHYLKVYNDNFVDDLISKLKDNYDLNNIDYSFYIKKEKENNYCITCHKNKVFYKDSECRECSSLKRRKIKDRPNKDELVKLVDKFGLEGVGRKYGVTGNAIKKWLKKEKILTFKDFNNLD